MPKIMAGPYAYVMDFLILRRVAAGGLHCGSPRGRPLTNGQSDGARVILAGILACLRPAGVRVASEKFQSDIAEQRLCAFDGRALAAAWGAAK